MLRVVVRMEMPGIHRPLEAGELSDGTLRYLALVAALLSPRPPELLALNEPETSLHQQLLSPLGRLIAYATAGVDPARMGLGPARALPKALEWAGAADAEADADEEARERERRFDRLAEHVRAHLDMGAVRGIMGLPPASRAGGQGNGAAGRSAPRRRRK